MMTPMSIKDWPSLNKPRLHKILDAGLLEIGQVSGVVQVSLRIQVTVADFDGVEEAEFGHRADYTTVKRKT